MDRLVSLTFLQTLAATELRLLESNMNTDTEHFDLRGQDEYSDEFAISIAINVARGFLQKHDVTARQIIGLGKALYALERLPASTPRVAIEFGVVLRVNINLEEMRYLEFRISDSVFQIARGGSIDLGAGSDSYSEPGWWIEVGGYRETECELYCIEEEVAELLAGGAKITVHDEFDEFR